MSISFSIGWFMLQKQAILQDFRGLKYQKFFFLKLLVQQRFKSVYSPCSHSRIQVLKTLFLLHWYDDVKET